MLKHQNKAYFVLFLVFINFAFIGLLSPWYVVRWDAYDYWLPRLHWMGNALRSGFLPGYLPYIFSGYPLNADIQAGVYNPVYLLAAFLFPNSIFSATFLYFFLLSAIFLSSYRIALRFFNFKSTAFYAAMSVVACGAVLPHSQHYSFLASYVGFLGIFCALLDLSEAKWRRGALLVFLSTWFVLTSGYATLLVSSAMVLVPIAILLSWKVVSSQMKFWGLASGAAVLGVLVSWPALESFLALLPLTDRGAGQSMEVVGAGSLPWKSLAGILFPFVTIKTPHLDLTMAQMNVLISTPLFVLYGLRKKVYAADKKVNWILAAAFFTFVILIMGRFFPLPIRMWLAEGLQVFRMGRFLCAEFKLFALMILIYFAGLTLEYLTHTLSGSGRRKLFIALALELMLILVIKRRFVLQPVEQAFFPPMKVEYSPQDVSILNQPRECPADQKTIYIASTSKKPFFGGPVFSAEGFSPMSFADYIKDFSEIAWAICSEGRLFTPENKQRIHYTLDYYNPRGLRFSFDAAVAGEMYLWSETHDPFWKLTINGKAAEFVNGLGHLRYFVVPQSGPTLIEMTRE